jgi:copper homeostasis protein
LDRLQTNLPETPRGSPGAPPRGVPEPRPPLVEIAVDSLAGARLAAAHGVDRIELCAALELGGLTPSRGLIEGALASHPGPVVVLVRPRPGNFTYDRDEVATMIREIDALLAIGEPRIAIATGALEAEERVAIDVMDRLIDHARPLQVVFHRAFDRCQEPRRALDALLVLGIERILSSGGAATALEGAARLAELNRWAAGRLAVVAAGGIDAGNLAAVLAATSVSEVHAAVGTWTPPVPSVPAASAAPAVAFRSAPPHDGAHRATDEARLAALLAAAKLQRGASPA